MLIAFYLLYVPSKLHTRNIFFILPITLLGHALDRLPGGRWWRQPPKGVHFPRPQGDCMVLYKLAPSII